MPFLIDILQLFGGNVAEHQIGGLSACLGRFSSTTHMRLIARPAPGMVMIGLRVPSNGEFSHAHESSVELKALDGVTCGYLS
jgi:hypothetical protein